MKSKFDRLKKFIARYKKIVMPVLIIAVAAICLSTLKIETVAEHNKKIANNDEIIILDNSSGIVVNTGTEANNLAENSGDKNSSEKDKTTNDKNLTDDENTTNNTGTLTGKNDDKENLANNSNSEGVNKGQTDTSKPEEKVDNKDVTENISPDNDKNKNDNNGSDKEPSGIDITPAVTPSGSGENQGQTITPSPTPTSTPSPTPTSTPAQSTKDEYITVTFMITCDKIVGNPELNTTAVIPEDGIFFSEAIQVKKSMSVNKILKAVCDETGMKYVDNGGYISSINNLSEKQCGKYSGWKYKVNGVAPNKGTTNCYLENGDECEFYYVTGIWD